jgi:hypothetical protein
VEYKSCESCSSFREDHKDDIGNKYGECRMHGHKVRGNETCKNHDNASAKG